MREIREKRRKKKGYSSSLRHPTKMVAVNEIALIESAGNRGVLQPQHPPPLSLSNLVSRRQNF